MNTRNDATAYVITCIESGDADRADFNIDAIVDDLHDLTGSWDYASDVTNETIDPIDFWRIVENHAL